VSSGDGSQGAVTANAKTLHEAKRERNNIMTFTFYFPDNASHWLN
jgi:hypothetical protein